MGPTSGHDLATNVRSRSLVDGNRSKRGKFLSFQEILNPIFFGSHPTKAAPKDGRWEELEELTRLWHIKAKGVRP